MMKSTFPSIFIIDDDKMQLHALQSEISAGINIPGLQVSTFETGEQCALSISKKPDVAIVDYNLDSKDASAMNGVDIIDMIKRESPGTEIIMFTAEENAEIAVQALQHGAHDYVVKNQHVYRKMNIAILQCLKLRDAKKESSRQNIVGIIAVILLTFIVSVTGSIAVLSPTFFK